MDQLTKYLVYNRTPKCRNDMDYDAIKAQKKEEEQKGGIIDKRLRLLSPDRESDYEVSTTNLFNKENNLDLFEVFSLPNADLLRTESLNPISLDLKSRLVALVIPKWTSSCEDLLLLDTEELMSVSQHYLYFRYQTQDGMLRKGVLGTVQDEYYERVLYARNKLLNGVKPAVAGGKPITDELATELRVICFSSASCPPRGEWIRTPLMMRPPDQPLGYGIAAPRNGTRSLLSALQAHVIKWLLFDSRPKTKDNKCDVPPDTYLRPSEERQEEALWRACSEVIWRCGGGGIIGQAAVEPKAFVLLPSKNSYVQHSSMYYQDGVTEKLHVFEFTSLEDLQMFVKRYLYLFQTEDGIGALLLLYACVLSRGCENIRKDLDGKLTHLVSAHVEGSINVVTLLLTGRATPYLHNGVLYVGDEDHYAMPQFGILTRSHAGLLIWYGGEENSKNNINKQYPGSRLKTPALPIWVTSCSGHYGVLFNTNRELLRNYHAERRFDIHYYTCGGCNVLLNVDTRAHDDVVGTLRSDDINATPLEKLIHTKWQDAKVTWTGSAPYVGEPAK